ncbi:MAG TPA: tetratricopeptide repeat protein, partial [candidate division Zixibacteria bacterium]|nr:tetratricopeptide repeat protein [candidate division Zixibacteria bacterium]
MNTCSGTKSSSDASQIEISKNLAGDLRDNKLYESAIEEYQKILEFSNLEILEQANINYLIARIYFEDLQNYQEAAAYYLRAKTLNPDASFASEASRNLVTSLEKMGHL